MRVSLVLSLFVSFSAIALTSHSASRTIASAPRTLTGFHAAAPFHLLNYARTGAPGNAQMERFVETDLTGLRTTKDSVFNLIMAALAAHEAELAALQVLAQGEFSAAFKDLVDRIEKDARETLESKRIKAEETRAQLGELEVILQTILPMLQAGEHAEVKALINANESFLTALSRSSVDFFSVPHVTSHDFVLTPEQIVQKRVLLSEEVNLNPVDFPVQTDGTSSCGILFSKMTIVSPASIPEAQPYYLRRIDLDSALNLFKDAPFINDVVSGKLKLSCTGTRNQRASGSFSRQGRQDVFRFNAYNYTSRGIIGLGTDGRSYFPTLFPESHAYGVNQRGILNVIRRRYDR